MFHFGTKAARIGAAFKASVPALALAAGLVGASVAQAETVVLDVGKMESPRTVNIAGLGNAWAAPVQFKALYAGKPVDLVAWCVDVYHHITLKDYAPNLQYTDTGELTTDFSPAAKPLEAGDTLKIGLLANYGQDVFDSTPTPPPAFALIKPKRNQFPNGSAGSAAYNAALGVYNTAKAAHETALANYNTAVSTRFTTLSAIQGAIWQVASNRNVTSTNHDAAFDALVDNLSGDTLTNYFGSSLRRGNAFNLLSPVQQYGGRNGRTPLDLTQSFVVAEVPEPATWVMLICGFGAVGAMLRRSRRMATTLTA